jgi:hypothetical protein
MEGLHKRQNPAPLSAHAGPVPAQRKCDCGHSPGADGMCEECRDKKGLSVLRKSVSGEGPVRAPPIVSDVLRSGGGRPLGPDVRDRFESSFGGLVNNGAFSRVSHNFQTLTVGASGDAYEREADRTAANLRPRTTAGPTFDFSKVRIHADARAAESARSVSAKAYTVGDDIVFAEGQYAPGTSAGDRLLGHELTHVVQQSGSSRLVQRAETDTSKGCSGAKDPGSQKTAVAGVTIEFEWTVLPPHPTGKGIWESVKENELKGKWGTGTSNNNSGDWDLFNKGVSGTGTVTSPPAAPTTTPTPAPPTTRSPAKP